MDENWFEQVLHTWPVWLIGVILFAVLLLAAAAGQVVKRRHDAREDDGEESQEGYTFSAVAGLLALLMGFTFTRAVARFATRRVLVREEAGAIGETYLRAQMLEEPHRAQVSGLLRQYVENRVQLGKAATAAQARPLLQTNDALIGDLWTATVSAWPTIRGYDFSSAFLESMNKVIDMDWTRKTARAAHVPPAIFAVMIVYLVVTAAMLGYLLRGERAKLSVPFLLGLFTLSLMLIIDIDRPTGGRIVESQRPMEDVVRFIVAHPAGSFAASAPSPAPSPAPTP